MLRKYLPKSLYARVALIVILPIFLMQSVITYVFFDRHWDLVSANLSANVAGQIALVTQLYQNAPDRERREEIDRWALEHLDLNVRFEEGTGIPQKDKLSIFNVYNSTLNRQLDEAIDRPYWFNTRTWPAYVEVRVQIPRGQLIIFAYRDRVFATTGPIFLFWLIGATIMIGAIAIVFLRNQVRSILRLATAAEAFGRGRDAPDYRPSGATEVRRAGYAFIAMRERIKRHIESRTIMLAGVSHDLRTPLTRIKLALAMEPDTPEVNALRNDVLEMERMVEAYLDFARDEAVDEEPEPFNLAEMVAEIKTNLKRGGDELYTDIPESIELPARRISLKRAISNLVNNGFRYADKVFVTADLVGRHAEIYVDDDGPGVDPSRYEDVFKPFKRLDDARDSHETGMGLGLAVVRDIARAHGGDVSLSRSEHGGLRATMRLPI